MDLQVIFEYFFKKSSTVSRFHYSFDRLYDEEGREEIYQDDMVDIVIKLCKFNKGIELFIKVIGARTFANQILGQFSQQF